MIESEIVSSAVCLCTFNSLLKKDGVGPALSLLVDHGIKVMNLPANALIKGRLVASVCDTVVVNILYDSAASAAKYRSARKAQTSILS